MMRTITFAKRCSKEIFRDPINIIFGLGFPVIILIMLNMINKNVPAEIYKIEELTPGITIFGLSFMTLFSATLISRDRESSFLQRLYTTPLKPYEYIIGYLLPIIPMSVVQAAICYIFAICLGLSCGINVLRAVCLIGPISIFYIGLGLLCGSTLNVKQVGGICGGLFTNISAWLSGAWFDIDLLGGTYKKLANILPFVHAVELEKAVLNGNYGNVTEHLLVVLGYGILVMLFATVLFLRQMK